MIEVFLLWFAMILFMASAIGFVVGVRMLIDWYEEEKFEPRMRKQRDFI